MRLSGTSTLRLPQISRCSELPWEMDTVIGAADNHCVVSLVERVSGAVLIGKLRRRNVAALNERVIELIRLTPAYLRPSPPIRAAETEGYRGRGFHSRKLESLPRSRFGRVQRLRVPNA